MKICSNCKENKELDLFHISSKSRDGRQSVCKKCKKEKDAERRKDPVLSKKIRLQNSEYRVLVRQQLYDFMKDKYCIKCGESERACLAFDHRDGEEKAFTIGEGVNKVSWTSLLKEIDKCDILCHNCHAKRTALQFNWYKDLK